MKRKLLVISILFLTLITLTACNKNSKNAIKFKNEYESLNGTKREKDGKTIRTINIPKDNPIVYKDAKDIIKMINDKETFVVYFGFSDCPWCRSVIPTLIDVSKDLKLDTIYYVDVKDIRDTITIDENNELVTSKKGTDDYYELIKLLDNVLSDYVIKDSDGNDVSTNEKRIFAPNIIAIVDGKVEALESGISDKQTDGYMKLTDEIKKDIYNKLSSCIELVVDTNGVCTTNSGC